MNANCKNIFWRTIRSFYIFKVVIFPIFCTKYLGKYYALDLQNLGLKSFCNQWGKLIQNCQSKLRQQKQRNKNVSCFSYQFDVNCRQCILFHAYLRSLDIEMNIKINIHEILIMNVFDFCFCKNIRKTNLLDISTQNMWWKSKNAMIWNKCIENLIISK